MRIAFARTILVLSALSLALAGLLGGCASQQLKFKTIDKRDQLRFAACRKDVARYLCPDDKDCEVKAAENYAEERADARLQWLLDHKCPKAKIRIADDAWNTQEKKRLGTK